jgi:glucan phosphoethanolaminetransferase (alkaline phosphatase superfamily)
MSKETVSLELTKYKKLVLLRLIFWWVWWIFLLFCVIGWSIDLFIGYHPFADALIIFVCVSIVVLIHKFPSSKSIMKKDKNNPNRQLVAEIALLEINRAINKKNIKKSQTVESLEQYKKELENERE